MLRSRIPEIARRLPEVIDDAIDHGAEAVVADARLRLHNVTGRLARSLEVSRDDRDGIIRITANAVAPESSPEGHKPYAHWVEYGSGHASPHPFLIPAFEAHRNDIVNDAGRAVRRLVDTGK